MSDVVGPAEPTLLLTTTRLSLDTHISKHYYLEIKPTISNNPFIGRAPDWENRYSIECRPDTLFQIILSNTEIFEDIKDIDFNMLVLDDGKIVMESNQHILTEKKIFSIAEFMCDLAELIEDVFE